jgi:hypothetical protein
MVATIFLFFVLAIIIFLLMSLVGLGYGIVGQLMTIKEYLSTIAQLTDGDIIERIRRGSEKATL